LVALLLSGSALPEFFSSTDDAAAVWRLSRLLASLLTTDEPILPYGPPSGSNSPSRTRIDRTFRTPLSMSASVISFLSRASLSAFTVIELSPLLAVKLSVPALRIAASPSVRFG
jgi:hypothetical protein